MNPQPANGFKIYVKISSLGRTCSMTVQPEDLVSKIIKKIHRHAEIQATDHQLLFYRGWPLHPDYTVAECHIQIDDARLHLISLRLVQEQPLFWKAANTWVSLLHNFLKGHQSVKVEGETCSILNILVEGLRQLLDYMTHESQVSDDLTSMLIIFEYLCASILVFLYVSPQQSNKEVAGNLIRMFLSRCTASICAHVVLEFCNQLSRTGAQGDPLYTLCISTLGLTVENLPLVKSLTDSKEISLNSVYPFFTELANKLIEGSRINVSPSEVRGFAAFLRPIKACAQDKLCNLQDIFSKLLLKMRKCLESVESEMTMTQKEDGGWDQYLIILREVHGIAKLYEREEDTFWSNVICVNVPLRFLIVTYAMRGEDYEWIIGHKDILDLKSRRHLAMILISNVKHDVLYHIDIDRSNYMADSVDYILDVEPEQLHGELFIEFKDELATGPGVVREWFIMVCIGTFSVDALFSACQENRKKFFPNPAAKADDIELFRFAGRVIALALMHSVQVGIMFDRTFFLRLAGIDVCLEDIKEADPAVYRSFKEMLDMDPAILDADDLWLRFVYEFKELGGSMKSVELLDNGENIAVNSKNRHEYVQLYVKHRFVKSVDKQVAGFAQGFADIVGSRETQELVFRTLEFEDYNGMLCGSENISVSDWKVHTEYHGYTESDPQISWFWEIVEEMNFRQRSVFLLFWTAMVSVPVDGFGGIGSRLGIHKSYDSADHLPSSRTCFFQLNLPSYPSLEVTRQQIEKITEDHVGSGFGAD